jgi:hypothetical protein
VEEIGRKRPITVAELMEEANRFADGEDAYNNKIGCSPEAAEQVDRGEGTVAEITKEGEIR